MEDELTRLFETARTWRQAGDRVALATVIETWGSAPRRVGSHLVLRSGGAFEGSVSGGCVEGDVIVEAEDVLSNGGVKRLDYGVADETAWRVGLACGGRISVLVQLVGEEGFAPALIERVLEARSAGREIAVTTDLQSGRSREGDEPGEGRFVRRYDPPLRLAIVGAVHIAQALVPMARLIGYAPIVIDPRGLFGTEARFADLAVDPRWPDEALAEWRPDAASAVVALTHDPKLDDPALAAALSSPAFYIAALGSTRNHVKRRERLAALGFDEAALARVHGPAGLAIGAANPPEIALAIAAEMTATWRARRSGG